MELTSVSILGWLIQLILIMSICFNNNQIAESGMSQQHCEHSTASSFVPFKMWLFYVLLCPPLSSSSLTLTILSLYPLSLSLSSLLLSPFVPTVHKVDGVSKFIERAKRGRELRALAPTDAGLRPIYVAKPAVKKKTAQSKRKPGEKRLKKGVHAPKEGMH